MRKKISENDKKVLEFLIKYKMLKVEDASLIYKRKRYYRERINYLIENKYVKRYKSCILIDRKGRKELKDLNIPYIKNINNDAYMDRHKYIASIASITINSNVVFKPSWELKNKSIYTETSRRYIGEMNIESKKFLVYYLAKKKPHVYIKQLMFDINKSQKDIDIIIFVENYDALQEKYSNLSFGKNNTYIIINNKENKEIIRKWDKIDIHEIIENMYDGEVYISDWNLADYMYEENKYILWMPFINTEAISRINWFYKENENSKKEIEIITLKENKEILEKLLSNKFNIKILTEGLIEN